MQTVASGKAKIKPAPGVKRKLSTDDWLPNAVVVTIGGLIYTPVVQWVMQFIGSYWEDGHLVDPDAKIWLLWPLIILGLFSYCIRIGGFLPEVDSVNSSDRYSSRTYEASSSSAMSSFIAMSAIFLLAGAFIAVPAPLTIATSAICFTGLTFLGLLYFIYPVPAARGYAVLTWSIGYTALWVIAATMGSVSIWVFTGVWIVLGALGGNTVRSVMRGHSEQKYESSGHTWRQKDVAPAAVQQSRRARMTSAVVSQYGRIPQDTFDLFNQQVRRVTGPIASSIPLGASEELRNITIREILNITLRDWRENDNLKGLQPVDIDDLRSFVDASIAIAGNGNDPASLSIYKVTLKSLLLDWLDNWNVDGQSGPPRRSYRG